MTSVCTRNLDQELVAVSARLMQICSTPYELKLPNSTETEAQIAKSIAAVANSVGYKRLTRDFESIDENWLDAFSLDHVCIWAMSGKYDVFADLLDGQEQDRGKEMLQYRTCLPRVSLEAVERRKAVLGEALSAYASEIQAQKMQRGRTR